MVYGGAGSATDAPELIALATEASRASANLKEDTVVAGLTGSEVLRLGNIEAVLVGGAQALTAAIAAAAADVPGAREDSRSLARAHATAKALTADVGRLTDPQLGPLDAVELADRCTIAAGQLADELALEHGDDHPDLAALEWAATGLFAPKPSTTS